MVSTIHGYRRMIVSTSLLNLFRIIATSDMTLE
jgi:hypothetical protein